MSCLICSALWTTIGLLVASVTVLDILKVGIQWSFYSLVVDTTTLYQPGRYFTGLGKEFVEFPSTIQMLVFSDTLQNEKSSMPGAQFEEATHFYKTIQARTSEGLPVGVELLIYYQLGFSDPTLPSLPAQFFTLYQNFGDQFDPFVSNVATYELVNLISTYSIADIFTQRKNLGDTYKQKLRNSLMPDYILITTANIMNIIQPAGYESAIESTVITTLNISLAQYQQQAAQINATTYAQLALKQANITIESAKATALVKYVYDMATANATSAILSTQTNMFNQIATNMGLTDDFLFSRAQKMLNYYWIFMQINNTFNSSNQYFSSMNTYQLNQFA